VGIVLRLQYEIAELKGKLEKMHQAFNIAIDENYKLRQSPPEASNCLNCNGKGVISWSNHEDNYPPHTCLVCNGTGKIIKPKARRVSVEEIKGVIRGSALNTAARAWAYKSFVEDRIKPDREGMIEYGEETIDKLATAIANHLNGESK
jgi:hypothetical protein